MAPGGKKLAGQAMRDEARREGFGSNVMSTCAGGLQGWLWTEGRARRRLRGVPTPTAEGRGTISRVSDVCGP